MKRILLGMLTPSSNTILEPVTHEMIREVPEASAHFGRFTVTRIALAQNALAQFDIEGILAAATLLSHAKCQVIGWSGTSSSWLGFDSDERLCNAIETETGAKACTSVLALNELFEHAGIKRFGLVTPYLDDVQKRIIANYQAAGYECVAERHLGLSDNYSFSEVGDEQLKQMIRDTARERPQAIVVLCTNLRGGPLVAALEAELNIPIFDSVATVVWKSLRLAGVDTRRVRSWGRIFTEFA